MYFTAPCQYCFPFPPDFIVVDIQHCSLLLARSRFLKGIHEHNICLSGICYQGYCCQYFSTARVALLLQNPYTECILVYSWENSTFTVIAYSTLITGLTDSTVCYLMYCWHSCVYMNVSISVHFPYAASATVSVTIANWTHVYVMFVTQTHPWH